MTHIYRSFLVLLLALFSWQSAFAQTEMDEPYQQEAERAKQLLLKAVAFYQEKGDAAFAAFSRQGDFIDDDLYVYVVDTAGVMLASGGPSVSLIGRKVDSVLNEDLQQAFKEALALPEDGAVHSAVYRWMNWKDGKVERKRVYFERAGNNIFAVGYYMPRSSEQEAHELLAYAAAAVKKDPLHTIERINNLEEDLKRDDLYVFVVDLDTGKFVAHGYNRRLVGTDFRALLSADRKPIGKQMLDLMKGKGEGEFSYQWRNPLTERAERKNALIRREGRYGVAVGYYVNDAQAAIQ